MNDKSDGRDENLSENRQHIMELAARAHQLVVEVGENDEQLREFRRRVPLEVGAIIGGIADKKERLALVRWLYEDPGMLVQSWALAAGLFIGSPPDDEQRQAEWTLFGKRNTYRLREVLTAEMIPCATKDCPCTVKIHRKRNGEAFFPGGASRHGICEACVRAEHDRYIQKYGTYEEQAARRDAEMRDRDKRLAELKARALTVMTMSDLRELAIALYDRQDFE
jgi:hypothetical protein